MKSLLIALLVIVSACVSSQQYVDAGGTRIQVEIANEPGEWSKGLMYRESMPQDSGMLFVFPDEAPRSFWMKNTLIPLDMIFIDSSGIITSISRNVLPCKTLVCESYYGTGKYVLEVNGGFSDASGLKEGDKLRLPD